jgi:preprotein translocase subunit SecF
MAKAKWFFGLSLILMLVGASAWFKAGSLPYGIDFKGGTLVYVRFAQPPKVDAIRSALDTRGLASSSIQEIKDLARPDRNEVVIGLELTGEQEQDLSKGKELILDALKSTFGTAEAGKEDLNGTNPAALSITLARRDPLGLGTTAGQKYDELAKAILQSRDAEHGGLISDFAQLKSVPGVTDAVVSAIRDSYSLGAFAVRNVEIVGPRVGEQLRQRAINATLYALGGMLVYIALRFAGGPAAAGRKTPSGILGALGTLGRWIDRIIFGAAAVLAVFHDVLITLGFFSLLKFEISLTVIAALLTLVGYSMNDKIVIFDRIRENLHLRLRMPLPDIVNLSINQTMSRTILTGGMTVVGVGILFFLGGDVLRGFAFALLAGIVIGTYSSFGIAAPIVVQWYRWRGGLSSAMVPSAGGRSQVSESASRLAAAGKR